MKTANFRSGEMATGDASVKVALVTGASTGIGRQIAGRLARAGYRVFGTSRQPAAESLDGFAMLPLDVTSNESAVACVQTVLAHAGRLDILVNNAGVEFLGAAEEASIEEARWAFETNFFGVMRMTQAVLPHMRACRQGVIVCISSLAGLGGAPFQGIYIATKHALEGYIESLWYEVEPLGVRVALVEPGFFRSEIGQRKRLPARTIPDYAADRARVFARWERLLADSPDPAPVAETVLAICDGRSTRLRHLVGRETRLSRFKLVVPEWLVRRRIRRLFGLEDPPRRRLK